MKNDDDQLTGKEMLLFTHPEMSVNTTEKCTFGVRIFTT